MTLAILGLILLIGFGLRTSHLLHVSPIGDEYITMLAVDSTLQCGYPRLPSGLYYDHGLLFIYIDTVFAQLFGFGQIVARIPSLMFGMLTIATTYTAARHWFSPRAGLAAASFMALSGPAITWSARARMYSLWSWLFLLAGFYLASGTLVRDSRSLRCLGIAALIGAAFSHILTIGLTVTLGLGLLLGRIVKGWNENLSGRFEKPLWPEAGLLTTGGLLLALLRRWGGRWGVKGRGIGDFASLLEPLTLLARVSAGSSSFTSMPQGILGLPVLAGAIFLAIRLIRRRARQVDPLLLYLITLVVGSVIGVGSLVRFHAERYTLALLAPLALLIGRELSFLGDLITHRKRPVLGLVLPTLLVAALLSPAAWQAATHDEINLDRAYTYVRRHHRYGDQIGTTIPAAAYILLGQCDYYVLERGVSLFHEGSRVDIWTSTPYYDSAEAFRPILDSQQRIWLIVDSWSWSRHYSTQLRGLIEDEMDLVFQLPGVRVYLHGG